MAERSILEEDIMDRDFLKELRGLNEDLEIVSPNIIEIYRTHVYYILLEDNVATRVIPTPTSNKNEFYKGYDVMFITGTSAFSHHFYKEICWKKV